MTNDRYILISILRIIQGSLLFVIIASILGLLVADGSLSSLGGLFVACVTLVAIGSKVLRRTYIRNQDVTIVRGWIRKSTQPWSAIDSVEVRGSDLILISGGKSRRVEGLDDGAWFPSRYQRRMSEAYGLIAARLRSVECGS